MLYCDCHSKDTCSENSFSPLLVIKIISSHPLKFLYHPSVEPI